MKQLGIKSRVKFVIIFSFVGLAFLMDACMQFRMSHSEIENYFEGVPYKHEELKYYIDKRVINYVKVGEDQQPLVVFVHGSPGSLSAFIHFLKDDDLLTRAQLISVDRPGFGASNFGNAEPSLSRQAALLKPILEEHQKNRPIILVGHSLGGPLIARMAMEYPELVDAIVMVAPSIDPELEPHEWFRGPLATPFLKLFLPRSLRASNDEIWMLKPQLQDMLPLWSNITARTIVIQGNEDTLVPPGNADFAEKMITNAQVEVIRVEGMNHFVPWSRPQLIKEAILKLLPNSNPGLIKVSGK